MTPTQAATTLMWQQNKFYLIATVCCIALPGFSNAQSTAVATNNSVSPAVYYANQAGTIAGAADFCGQPIDIMTARSQEVIGILAKNNFQDQTAAQGAFDAARQAAKTSGSLPACNQVVHDFINLPLLQANYQTTVLAPLRASNAVPATSSATPPAAAPSIPATASTAPPITTPVPTPAPPANPIFPALSTPAQNYVSSNNSQNYVAPINPGYPPNTGNTAANTAAQNTEATKLQLAQQLAQIAQTLVTPPGQPVPGPVPPEFNQNAQRQLATRQAGSNPIFPDNP